MDEKEFVWVEMEVAKEQDNCSTYRGQIKKEILEQILVDEYKGKFFRLHNIHWLSEDYDEMADKTIIKYYVYGIQGDLSGLEGSSYYRTEDIREISPLIKGYREHFESAKIHSMIE